MCEKLPLIDVEMSHPQFVGETSEPEFLDEDSVTSLSLKRG